jgi:hypothetical protein
MEEKLSSLDSLTTAQRPRRPVTVRNQLRTAVEPQLTTAKKRSKTETTKETTEKTVQKTFDVCEESSDEEENA